MDVRRIVNGKRIQEVGAEQIQVLTKARSTILEALDTMAFDGRYWPVWELRLSRSVKGLR